MMERVWREAFLFSWAIVCWLPKWFCVWFAQKNYNNKLCKILVVQSFLNLVMRFTRAVFLAMWNCRQMRKNLVRSCPSLFEISEKKINNKYNSKKYAPTVYFTLYTIKISQSYQYHKWMVMNLSEYFTLSKLYGIYS